MPLTSKLSRAFMLTVLLAVGVVLPAGQGDEGLVQTRERPNIVFILTDDLDAESISVMPKLHSLLTERGTTFNNAFVTNPLCCPSRATFLRGQYSHNTKILSSSPQAGGHQKFHSLGLDRSTVATWLEDAGYDTFFAGKYMNGYDDTKYVPPGWDRWFGWLGSYHSPDGKYRLNENGKIESYNLDQIHDTDLLKEKAVSFIENQEGDGQPFFVYLAPNAPHTPAYVAKRHEGMFSGRSLPSPPSFNEEDVSDKPKWVRRPKLSNKSSYKKTLGDLYRRRLGALQSVDGMVGALISTLRDTGQLDNTYFMFTSDNGYLLEEHRLTGKRVAYEESIGIPFIVRGPDVPAQRVDHLVINNDFAPTVAELAGVEPPSFVDGKSFVPLLRTEKPDLEEWRTGFLVEQHQKPAYKALRTNGHTYVKWPGDDRELYDLSADPYQLRSLHDKADPAFIAGLSAQLEALRDCDGEQCRAAERG